MWRDGIYFEVRNKLCFWYELILFAGKSVTLRTLWRRESTMPIPEQEHLHASKSFRSRYVGITFNYYCSACLHFWCCYCCFFLCVCFCAGVSSCCEFGLVLLLWHTRMCLSRSQCLRWYAFTEILWIEETLSISICCFWWVVKNIWIKLNLLPGSQCFFSFWISYAISRVYVSACSYFM